MFVFTEAGLVGVSGMLDAFRRKNRMAPTHRYPRHQPAASIAHGIRSQPKPLGALNILGVGPLVCISGQLVDFQEPPSPDLSMHLLWKAPSKRIIPALRKTRTSARASRRKRQGKNYAPNGRSSAQFLESLVSKVVSVPGRKPLFDHRKCLSCQHFNGTAGCSLSWQRRVLVQSDAEGTECS